MPGSHSATAFGGAEGSLFSPHGVGSRPLSGPGPCARSSPAPGPLPPPPPPPRRLLCLSVSKDHLENSETAAATI